MTFQGIISYCITPILYNSMHLDFFVCNLSKINNYYIISDCYVEKFLHPTPCIVAGADHILILSGIIDGFSN